MAGAPDHGQVRVPVAGSRSVKDAIESCGVPHTEVDLVVVGGTSEPFGRALSGGEIVQVYPWDSSRAGSPVRPPPLAARFLLDVHLGRLAERLRLLGLDTSYRNNADDAALANQSVADGRWLLTRDRGLLMRAVVTHGYLVRAADPRSQALEVVRRFGLAGQLEPFTRCARCNGLLAPVDKAAIADQLLPGTRRDHDEFVRCGDCGHLYWQGSHYGELQAFVEKARRP